MTLVKYHSTPMQWMKDSLNESFGWLTKDPQQKDHIFNWQPHVDVEEHDANYLIKVDVPGVSPKDVDVDITDGIVTIRGERSHERKGKGCYERQSGKFYRCIQLPKGINGQQAKAKGKNGVLEIEIPKMEPSTVQYIEVEEG